MMNSGGKTSLILIHAMGILWRFSSTGVHASLVYVTHKEERLEYVKAESFGPESLDLCIWDENCKTKMSFCCY